MQLRNVRLDGPWGTCLLSAAFAAFAIWYAWDAYGASPRIQNLLFIIPVAAVAVVVCAALIVGQAPRLRVVWRGDAPAGWSFRQHLAVPAYCLASVLYVAAMPFIGFDVATALFVAAGMAIQGERRWWVLIALPVPVGLLSVYAMRSIMSFPIPTLLFG